MPTIPVTVASYPSPYSARNGSYPWKISRTRLEYAVISVGMLHFANAFASSSAAQLSWGKAYCISSTCDWSKANLVTPPFYSSLDQSEKVNLSFWRGMAFAKIAAQRILGIGVLEHAASLLKAGALTVGIRAGSSLADLVGIDPSGAYHVFEAKGYRTKPRAEILAKWKTQAQTITHVNKVQVATSSRCLVITGGQYRLEVVDPPVKELPRHSIEVDWAVAYERKMAPLNIFLDSRETIQLGLGLVRARQVGFDPNTNSKVYIGIANGRPGEMLVEGRALTYIGPDLISLSYIGGDVDRLQQDLVEDLEQESKLQDVRVLHDQQEPPREDRTNY